MIAYRTQAPPAGELYIRLQITRGAGRDWPRCRPGRERATSSCWSSRARRFRRRRPGQASTFRVATSLRRNPVQSLDPAWKTGNYLNNLLCLREARERGADDVVMLNLAGELTESVRFQHRLRPGGEICDPAAFGRDSGRHHARPPARRDRRRGWPRGERGGGAARRTCVRWRSASCSPPPRMSCRSERSTDHHSRSARTPWRARLQAAFAARRPRPTPQPIRS